MSSGLRLKYQETLLFWANIVLYRTYFGPKFEIRRKSWVVQTFQKTKLFLLIF